MGRHREFDVDVALESALRVFWEKGYEGTSFDDLTEATGVVRPGLYSAFGNKESLFLKVLDRYDAEYAAYMGKALEEPTSREVVKHALEGSVNLVTCYRASPGCMSVNNALGCSDNAARIRDELIKRRNDAQQALQARLKRAQAEGDLAKETDCAVLAGYVMAVIHGLSVQAKAGASKAALTQTAQYVLSNWPMSPAAHDVRPSKPGARVR